MTPNIVAFSTRKGGAGKTTLAIGFASICAEAGKRTLLIDLDQEGHSTCGIGAEVGSMKEGVIENFPGSAEFLTGNGLPIQKVNGAENLHVLAGNNNLEDPAIGRLDPEALADAIGDLPKNAYDVIVIDCPPNAHLLSRMGVIAARTVFIPANANIYATLCAQRLIEDLRDRQRRRRTGASRWAVVANLIDQRRAVDIELVNEASSLFPDTQIFVVRQNILLASAANARCPVTVHKASKEALQRVREDFTPLITWSEEGLTNA